MQPDTLPEPVRLTGRLDGTPSRWLWLVKWLLAIPHYIVLFFLWIAVWVVTIIAFFAVLITARYPRSLFDFTVGVLRWSWRVGYYSYSVLGTDRYPPFTLAERDDYPATLTVVYPERLSRGLVLVKWWLLVIPHYLLAGAIAGGAYGGYRAMDGNASHYSTGASLAGLLVLYVAVTLLFAGRYPRGIYDLLMGIHRWGYRVAAYVSLLTDRYPPFRLDQGGAEPGLPTPGYGGPTPDAPGTGGPAPGGQPYGGPAAGGQASGWPGAGDPGPGSGGPTPGWPGPGEPRPGTGGPASGGPTSG
ncbi:DUF4389 domain-containing protein [Actinocatenispora rupis]|uniref:DUF4389 domain-containing protein n=1 Tax=Actinocatenispora rupis TaxID=519421 RepID=A0A8J3J6G6_9ACTN|nr:DUF4389 domain-containing protein [Actinocatenispora rupis]GID11082.1 hypothetical protein Aru02nite_19710 [Actinocatenispora rupis]